jgi:hypothetical protein
MEPRRLAEEAVDLVHLGHRRFGPSFLIDDGLYFLSQGLTVRRVGSQVKYEVREGLEGVSK